MKRLINKLKNSMSHWLILFFLIMVLKTNAQYNLVINHSFEIYTKCPKFGDDPPPAPWYVPSGINYQNTYLNACDIVSCTSVPYNCLGVISYQPAHTGNAYVLIGCYDIHFAINERGYMQTKLKDSLRVGKRYYAEFFVSLTNPSAYGCNNVSMLFTKTAQYVDTLADPYGLITANAQIVNYGNPIIKDTMNWVKVSGIFKAQGGEQYITLGNFKDDSQTDTITVNHSTSIAYGSGFYLDDVSVIPLDSMCLQADAGKDVTINAGDSAFIGSYTNGIDSLLWLENGTIKTDSTRPGFYVTPSSTTFYVLHQIVNGCFSSDTVWVNVLLPLKFISYNIQETRNGINEKQVTSNWTTANEINVSHFNIQRSTNGKDFTTIAQLKAQNKSLNNYSFIDELTPNTQYPTPLYYRVVAVDFDGKKTYSEIRKLVINHSLLNVNIYPNPANDVLNIDWKEGIKEIEITDYLGRLVYKNITKNINHLSLNINHYQRGIYFIKVLNCNTGNLSVQKVILQ